MEKATIALPSKKYHGTVPLVLLLKLDKALKKTIFSNKFYHEINDKILSSSSGIDANLYFICYSTLLLSSILNNKHKIRSFLQRQRANLAKVLQRYFGIDICSIFPTQKRESSLKGEQLPENKEKSPTTTETVSANVTPSKLAVHLSAISSYVSDIRIFNRLPECIRYMPWILGELAALRDPKSSVAKLDRLINFAQAINCLILELLENIGWLTDHNWIGTNDNVFWCTEAYIWCSRVWGAYIVIDIIELFRRTPASKRNKDWRINLFTQVIQLPLVIHWSLYDGCLTPFWVGLCGSGASWYGFKNIWRSLDLA